ncbi:MAG: hypothetical protein VW879_02480, partial [Opitutae bacterium]
TACLFLLLVLIKVPDPEDTAFSDLTFIRAHMFSKSMEVLSLKEQHAPTNSGSRKYSIEYLMGNTPCK